MVLKWLTALFLLLFAGSAAAQTQPMYLVGLCMSRADIAQWMQELGEQSAASGFGFVEEALTGGFPQGIVTLWINPETGTYSVSIEFADGVNCLLTAGDDFAPTVIKNEPA
jgi:hypothetical protein